MLILTLSVSSGAPTSADGVCGDNTVNPSEQCDDGNLENGDGCSSTCTIERCGNRTLDTGEQCDDGNVLRGDGCNRACQIEFCGDHQIQTELGEQCDDGNGISGDGCSSACAREGAVQNAAVGATHLPPSPPRNNAEAVQRSIGAQMMIHEAQTALGFLASPAGEASMRSLGHEQNIKLGQILQNVKNGRRLTQEERPWAEQIASALEKAKVIERKRVIDVLQRFIASPISMEILEEKKLKKDQLTDVDEAILRLRGVVTVLQRDELQEQVALNIDKLKRQGIPIERGLPPDVRAQFGEGRAPLDVLSVLLSLKEATEKDATDALPASLETIRREAGVIRQALPVFQREYGLRPEEAEVFLQNIETVSREVTKKDADRVVAAVNRFLSHLERRRVISHADLVATPPKSAGGGITSLASDVAKADVTALAPARYREIFARGTTFEQRAALLEFLTEDERIWSFLATLRHNGSLDADLRFEKIQRQIIAVGSAAQTDDPCSASISEALRCTNAYLQDLQDTIRSRTIFSRIVGTLQDFFGIGS